MAYVLLVGPSMLDHYIVCNYDRLDQTAAVPRGVVLETHDRLGGAANTFANLVSLGAQVCFVTNNIVASSDTAVADARQTRLLELLVDQQRRVERRAQVAFVPGGKPAIKTRVVTPAGRLMARMDDEPSDHCDRYDQVCEAAFGFWDKSPPAVVVISDYNKGVISREVCQRLIRRARAEKIPVVVDPYGQHATWYHNAHWITPNYAEAGEMLTAARTQGSPYGDVLRRALCIDHVLVTSGGDGMSLSVDGWFQHFSAYARVAVDTTGAGDTVVAALAAALAERHTAADACRWASLAAAVVVCKPLTAVAYTHEVRRVGYADNLNKVVSLDEALQLRQSAAAAKECVVVVNGCFDLLHEGHRFLLRQARSQAESGGLVIVLLNSDESVRRLKGDNRPIQSQQERAAALSANPDVDAVVVFADDKPTEMLRTLAPEFVLRSSSSSDPYEDSDVINVAGVVCVTRATDHSTTDIVRRARGEGGEDGG